MVSVLMPVFNGGDYLKEVIESVLFQDYPDFEFIVVNDGSTDKTAEILSHYPNIKVYHTKNRGISAARKLAFEKSKGDYIAIHDADVIMEPNRLSFGMKHIKDFDIFYSNTGMLFKNGAVNFDGYKIKDIHEVCKKPEDVLDPSIPNGNQVVPNFTVLAKRECFEGAYVPEYKINDDLWTIFYWMKKGYRFTFTRKTLTYHIDTGNNTSNRTEESIAVADKIRRKYGVNRNACV